MARCSVWGALLALLVLLVAPAQAEEARTRVAFQRNALHDGPANIVVMYLHGDLNTRELGFDKDLPGPRITPALSRDGIWLAFATSVGDQYKLYTCQLDDNNTVINTPVRLTTDDQLIERYPAWSPDGERIAYFATEGQGKTSLRVVNKDGTGMKVLAENMASPISAPCWSPDSGLLFYLEPVGAKRVLKNIPVNGGKPVATQQNNLIAVALSPLGDQVAGLVRMPDGTAALKIFPWVGVGGNNVVLRIKESSFVAWTRDGIIFNGSKVGELKGDGFWQFNPEAKPGARTPKVTAAACAASQIAAFSVQPMNKVQVAKVVPTPEIPPMQPLAPAQPAQPAAPAQPAVPAAPVVPVAPVVPAVPVVPVQPVVPVVPVVPVQPAVPVVPVVPVQPVVPVAPVVPVQPPVVKPLGPVTIKSPLNDSILHGVVMIDVLTQPNIAYCNFSVGDQFLFSTSVDTLDGKPPSASYAWDTQALKDINPHDGKLPKDYAEMLHFPDGQYTLRVVGLDTASQFVGEATVAITVQNSSPVPPDKRKLHYAFRLHETDSYLVHGEATLYGATPGPVSVLNASVDALVKRTVTGTPPGVAQYETTLRGISENTEGADLPLTFGTKKTSLPEAGSEVTGYYTLTQRGVLNFTQQDEDLTCLSLGQIATPLPAEPATVKDHWNGPLWFVGDVLQRTAVCLDARHVFDGVEYVGGRETVRIRSDFGLKQGKFTLGTAPAEDPPVATILHASDDFTKPSAAPSAPSANPGELPPFMKVITMSGVRYSWFDNTSLKLLRVEDFLLYTLRIPYQAGTPTYIVHYVYTYQKQ